MAAEKTLSERLADETLTDNTQFLKFEQCRDCAFRYTNYFLAPDGRKIPCTEEIGYQKSSCHIFPYPKWKPHGVVYGEEQCEYYEKEKRSGIDDGT